MSLRAGRLSFQEVKFGGRRSYSIAVRKGAWRGDHHVPLIWKLVKVV